MSDIVRQASFVGSNYKSQVVNKTERIKAFSELGNHLGSDSPSLQAAAHKAYMENNWFTPENIDFCLKNWSKALTTSNIQDWLSTVPEEQSNSKIVGIVMAGNVPLVGLHDLLSVVGSGHKAKVKLSQNDTALMQYCIDFLKQTTPHLENHIEVAKRLIKPDAIIATGSNNTARYFEYYYKDIPRIIRKNRTSVAVLTGHESTEELVRLTDDIFQYFGLGCRNVTKLLIPSDYDLVPLLDCTEKYKHIADHHKFANNHTYHRALFLMNQTKHLDTGFLLVKEDEKLHSPLSCLFYSYYENESEAKAWIEQHSEEIQVVVSHLDGIDAAPFGSTQHTTLLDYADGVNTLDFLSKV